MAHGKTLILPRVVLLVARIGGTLIQNKAHAALVLYQSQCGLIGRSLVLDVKACSRYRLIRRVLSVVVVGMKFNAEGIF
jgi:hypothetical protein